MSKVITMIPARMASSRLPNKPLLDINGKPLIQRVYENVKAAIQGDVVIAAGDKEGAQKAFKKAEGSLARAAGKRTIKKRTAARQTSRLAAAVKALFK
jgi:3-deoxy-manno-octulosonate cytidylyltransferase (CMP-KDO synthetase)